jgi:hypothetical protein
MLPFSFHMFFFEKYSTNKLLFLSAHGKNIPRKKNPLVKVIRNSGIVFMHILLATRASTFTSKTAFMPAINSEGLFQNTS